jgi:AcrR family transcriptional regulator
LAASVAPPGNISTDSVAEHGEPAARASGQGRGGETAEKPGARDVILDCACALFAEGGFAGTSMRSLARTAQTSQALIHHHFGTKLGLYHAVRDRLIARLAHTEVLRPPLHPPADPVADLAAAMHGYAGFLRANPEFLRIATWARLEGETGWAGPRDLLAPMADALHALQDAGFLRAELDVNLHLLMLGGVVEHWVSNLRTFSATFAPEEHPDALTDRYFKQAASVIAHGATAVPELS